MKRAIKRNFQTGDPFIWLTGGGLAFCILLVCGLVFLILMNGLGFFWPRSVIQFQLTDGRIVLGEIAEREPVPLAPGSDPSLERERVKIKQGNRDLYGLDFLWVDESQIENRQAPSEAVVFERLEWGNFYGFIQEVRLDSKAVASGPEESWKALQDLIDKLIPIAGRIKELETKEIGKINYRHEELRLQIKKLNRMGSKDGEKIDRLNSEIDLLKEEYDRLEEQISGFRAQLKGEVLVTTPDGKEKEIPASQIVRMYRPNQMGFWSKVGFYFYKIWVFMAHDPRESNTEGGVFPAIFGTVMMVVIMALVVTPFGVIAAFFLREYAKQGRLVSLVRIAVNNLAGVPSIVFGVFGVGFFIYFVGGTIDRVFYPESLPNPVYGTGGILWASLTLALLTVPVVIVATEEGLASIPNSLREASLSLGATKFETIYRVVLPAVLPAVLTGVILAMARAAGEVAPLMITGVVKLAPSLPVDSYFPFIHLERKFMHLGFHIYDVGFQSPNVDASRPMVFTTTMLLLLIVLFLNLGAIKLRNHLKKKFAYSTF